VAFKKTDARPIVGGKQLCRQLAFIGPDRVVYELHLKMPVNREMQTEVPRPMKSASVKVEAPPYEELPFRAGSDITQYR
jgi:hypothetical protein